MGINSRFGTVITEQITASKAKNWQKLEAMQNFNEMTANSKLRKEIEQAINKHSLENGSDTPDFILAEYLTDCLRIFDKAVNKREEWYGRKQRE